MSEIKFDLAASTKKDATKRRKPLICKEFPSLSPSPRPHHLMARHGASTMMKSASA